MVWLDQVARSSTIALLAIMAVVMTRDFPRVPLARAAIPFFLTIAAHLALTSPDYGAVRGLDFVLQVAALAAPGAFMLFSRALFDEDARFRGRDAATVGGLVAAGLLRSTQAAGVGVALYYAGGLWLVASALVQVARGLPADLVEPRRRLRSVFVIAAGLEILVVLGAELLLGGERPPRWIDTTKSVSAFGLTVLFAGWFLAPRQDVFAAEEPAIPPGGTPTDARKGNSEDARFTDRLLTLMRVEKAYRQEGLTIALLARKLDLPEYRLRRMINAQLGYRNFNAFLNDLRIEEACQILADPAHERLPILNLALDLGYGSPGPFNRAFRAKTGQTPTEYRRSRLGTSSPAA